MLPLVRQTRYAPREVEASEGYKSCNQEREELVRLLHDCYRGGKCSSVGCRVRESAARRALWNRLEVGSGSVGSKMLGRLL